jgi:hypothetical protein
MATLAWTQADDTKRFFKLAVAMAITIVLGFSFQLAMGRSSFDAPLIVHGHAVLFMGWVGFYVLQNSLVARGNVALHRRMGRLAVPWVMAMLVLGVGATVGAVQQGRVPFFFLPQHFLIADISTLLCFAALTAAAIAMRRRTDWHRRLHLCAMAVLMGPAFGRLLPMPFMGPANFEIAALFGLVFPLIAIWREARSGGVHPAWRWGLPALPLTRVAGWLLGHSALGTAIYDNVTAGTPGAAFAPLAYPPPPPM